MEKKVILLDEKSYGSMPSINSSDKLNKPKRFYPMSQISNENKKIEKGTSLKSRFWQWLHTKQAYKFLAFAIVLILLVAFMIIWGIVSKTKISAYFENNVKVMFSQIESEAGTSRYETQNISIFENNLDKTQVDYYRELTFTAKSNANSIGLTNLYFMVYSIESADYEIILTLSNPNLSQDLIYKKDASLKQQSLMQFSFNINRSLNQVNSSTTMKLEFIPKNNSAKIAISNMIFVA